MSESRRYAVACLPGDGIGPEVIAETRKVIEAAASRHAFGVEWTDYPFGAGHYLKTGEKLAPPEVAEIRDVLVGHLDDLYAFYGAERGSRVARKHIAWYTKGLKNSALFRARMNQLQTSREQLDAVRGFFDGLAERSQRLEYDEEVALAA